MTEETLKKLKERSDLHHRVIFGDEDMKQKGIMGKVDDMHEILMQAKSVSKFFGGIGGTLKWVLIIAAVITVFKAWGASIIAMILHSKS